MKSNTTYTHCYPFGMLMPGRHYNADKYRFGFQGQEKDDEIKGVGNSVNYKFRMHDPRIGRFFARDPLYRKYPYNSPYAFSENRVIDKVELEGLETAPYPGAHKGQAMYDSNGDGKFSDAEKTAAWEANIYGAIMAIDVNITFGAISTFLFLHDFGEAAHASDQAMEAQARGDMATYDRKMKESQSYSVNVIGEVTGIFLGKALGWSFRNARVLAGEWKSIRRSFASIDAAQYQSQISGKTLSNIDGAVANIDEFKYNGVDFDGYNNGVLLDAKYDYSNFVSKKTGKFYDWFKGKNALLKEARRQLDAADGAKIQWSFSNKSARDATERLFKENGIEGIELKHIPKE